MVAKRSSSKPRGRAPAYRTQRRGRPRLLTRHELARALGPPTHPQTISKWVDEGLPVARRGRGGRPSLYDEQLVRAWLAAREAAKANDDPTDAILERARKERAQAQLAEQLFQTRAGKLIPVEDVERVLRAQQAAVRTKILAIPTTQADRVCRTAVIDGVAGVETLLRDIAHDVLRELADPDLYKAPPAAPIAPAPPDPSTPSSGDDSSQEAVA